jgi:hypothetical protein
MLISDGAYLRTAMGPVFRPLAAPKRGEPQALAQQFSRRLQGHSITYRIAVGPHQAGARSSCCRLVCCTRLRKIKGLPEEFCQRA